MTQPMEVLRQEHRLVRARLAAVRALADSIDEVAAAELNIQLDGVVRFLDGVLVPHAIAEDDVLYPVVAKAMGAPQATATMSRDHLEILRMADQLRHLAQRFRQQQSKRLRRDIRRGLYHLEAIGLLHLDKEEEVYLPLLEENLPSAELATMSDELERATAAMTPSRRFVGTV